MRIGQGWDRHRLVPGRRCVLGGVEFPDCPVGPLGHSDGDAATHAVIDALLGAAALGDLGALFPDTDPRCEGADSLALLRTAWDKVRNLGFVLHNVDLTVITERPLIAPAARTMARTLAEVLGVPELQIGVKATRGEGMGPEGRGECVTVLAVALLEKT